MSFKRSEKFGFPMIFLIYKFICQISIEFCIKNPLLQKFLQTDMIFFKVPTVKLEKCFAEFCIPIALLKEFGS